MPNSDLLTETAENVDRLVTWTHDHDERHRLEERRTNIVLDLLARQKSDLHTHNTNHHGPITAIKRDGLLVTAVSLLYLVVELVRNGVLIYPF